MYTSPLRRKIASDQCGLDSNLKTEFNNLYVCDCSVIPEAWGLPPSLTLLALGKRLGMHLTGGSATIH
ncbi:MAG: hypothetical protein IMY76_06580 [Chloroflexi bacterium]|nr:hypothetical protein [Chloroflexota bacterium]